MATIALMSAKGSPGVTTTGLAMCLSWLRRTLFVEADPAGGDTYAGLLGGQLEARWGLHKLAVADYRGRLADELWKQVIDLNPPHRDRLLLPGIPDPAQAASLDALWERLGGLLARMETNTPPWDVILDCGRVPAPHSPLPLIRRADVVLLVTRGTLPALSAAYSRIQTLQADLAANGTGADALGVVLVGDGPYNVGEVRRRLGVHLVVTIPQDSAGAEWLTFGTDRFRARSALVRAAASAEEPVRDLINRRRARLAPPTALAALQPGMPTPGPLPLAPAPGTPAPPAAGAPGGGHVVG